MLQTIFPFVFGFIIFIFVMMFVGIFITSFGVTKTAKNKIKQDDEKKTLELQKLKLEIEILQKKANN